MAPSTNTEQPLLYRRRWQVWLKRLFVGLSGLLLVGVCVGLWALETGRAAEFMRREIQTELKERCDVDTEFDEITLQILSRRVTLTQLKLTQAGGDELISVEQAVVQLRLLPLLYGRVQLQRVDLQRPKANIEYADGAVQNLPACVAPKAEDDRPTFLALGVQYLSLHEGEFGLDVGADFHSRLQGIDFALSPAASGGVDLRLTVDKADVKVKDRAFEVTQLDVDGHVEGALVRPRALVIDTATAAIAGFKVAGSGAVDFLGPVYEAELRAQGDLRKLNVIVPGLPDLAGDLDLRFALAGSLLTPRFSGDVTVEKGRVAGFGLGDQVQASFRGSPTEVVLPKISLRLGRGRAEAEGRVELLPELQLQVRAEPVDVSLARVLHELGIAGSWADLKATGSLDLNGPLSPMDLRGTLDVAVADFGVHDRAHGTPGAKSFLEMKSAQVRTGWRIRNSGVRFDDFSIESGSSQAFGNATVDFEQGLSVQADFPSIDVLDLGPIAGLSFTGFGTAAAEIDGPWEVLEGRGNFELAGISVGGIPFGAGRAVVRWHDLSQLDMSGFEARLGNTVYGGDLSVTLEGEVPISVRGRIHRGRLEDMMVPLGWTADNTGDLKGDFTGDFDLVGPVDRLTGPVIAQVKNMTSVGEHFDGGPVMARMEQGRIVVDSFDLKKGRSRFFGGGSIDSKTQDVSLQVMTRGANIQDLNSVQKSMPELRSKVDLQMLVGGRLGALNGTVSASLSDVRAGPRKFDGGDFSGRFEGESLFITGRVDKIKLTALEIELARGLPYFATIDFNRADLPGLVAGLAGHERYRGEVTGRAEPAGRLVYWERSGGKIRLDHARFTQEDLTLETGGRSDFEMLHGVLATKRIAVTAPRTRIVAAGRFGGRLIDMDLSGRIDLALAEALWPSVEHAAGSLVLDASVGGRFDRLTMVGSGRVDGASLELSTFENRLTQLSGDLSFSQSSVIIDRSVGKWAGGTVRMTGSLALKDFLVDRVAIEVVTKDVRPRFTLESADLVGSLDGRVSMTGPLKRLAVRGDLEVRRGRIRPKIDWSKLVGSGRFGSVYDPSAENFDFDLTMRPVEPIRVKSEDVDLRLRGVTRLTGTNERMGMIGTLSVEPGGRALFLGREYTTVSGVIELPDRYRFAPQYDLLVSASACGAAIRLNLLGTFERIQTQYSSKPEMPQSDIVSCLIRGVRGSELDQDLGAFAGSALLKLSGVDRQVKKVLPIDRIDVTTEYSSFARAYEPRVLIGTDLTLIDRPARLEYSTSLLRSNDQRAALRMGLTPRLNLQLGWTSSEDVPYGDWGLDLKQRWEW